MVRHQIGLVLLLLLLLLLMVMEFFFNKRRQSVHFCFKQKIDYYSSKRTNFVGSWMECHCIFSTPTSSFIYYSESSFVEEEEQKTRRSFVSLPPLYWKK